MVSLGDVGHRPGCITLITLKVSKSGTLVLYKLRVQPFAVVALYVDGEILLVQTGNKLVLNTRLQNEIAFTAEAALYVKL